MELTIFEHRAYNMEWKMMISYSEGEKNEQSESLFDCIALEVDEAEIWCFLSVFFCSVFCSLVRRLNSTSRSLLASFTFIFSMFQLRKKKTKLFFCLKVFFLFQAKFLNRSIERMTNDDLATFPPHTRIYF